MAEFIDGAARSNRLKKRYTQLFALAILIGAPILVSLVNNALPQFEPDADNSNQNLANPDASQDANTQADIPQPPPPPVTQAGTATASPDGATLSTEPIINPQGTDVTVAPVGLEPVGTEPVPAADVPSGEQAADPPH